MTDSRLERALAAIDTANTADPVTLEVRGERRPKELAHAELASEWVERLAPGASAALRIAARAHHLQRWKLPRDRYPKDRPGYLRWRRELQRLHAETCAGILRDVGYDDAFVTRVSDLIQKRGLARDPEARTLEDALCLVFLETQLADFAAQLADSAAHGPAKIDRILDKTLAKMSEAGRVAAVALSAQLSAGAKEIVDRAVARLAG